MPNDLDREVQTEMTKDYVQSEFVDKGMVADISIHRDDINNPHAIIEMRKRLMQNAALSIALLKILDTKGIPAEDCEIPSNLPQYAKMDN